MFELQENRAVTESMTQCLMTIWVGHPDLRVGTVRAGAEILRADRATDMPESMMISGQACNYFKTIGTMSSAFNIGSVQSGRGKCKSARRSLNKFLEVGWHANLLATHKIALCMAVRLHSCSPFNQACACMKSCTHQG